MREKTYSNKLSIYLIKDEYSKPELMFKEIEGINGESIGDFGTLYFGESHVSTPAWIRKFFGQSFNNMLESTHEGKEKSKIFTASSKAAFVINTDQKTFAICFGYGHTLLRPGTWEENFGLRVALNVVDSENLRSIDKTNMAVIPKLSTEQISRHGNAADFGIDIEQDLIQGITGKSKLEEFGQSLTGKDALSVSISIDIADIKGFLTLCLEKYQSDDYKDDFPWIDQISQIKDPYLVEKLNEKMVVKIKEKNFEKVWMSIPEIVKWENIADFRISKTDHIFGDDIHLPLFLDFLSDEQKKNLSTEILKKVTIDCVSSTDDNVIDTWKAYNCLYCEIDEGADTFILSNGKWYKVNNDFSSQVNSTFQELANIPSSLALPACQDGEHEDKYNNRVPDEVPSVCNMDRKMIMHGGGLGKIEFCDLLTEDKKIIHVKRYGASSVLSHLFSQGLVSGELFLRDNDFREKVRNELPASHKLVVSERPDPRDFEIIYAIISKDDKNFDIPFFSKVNLRSAKNRLETFGYKVSLQKICFN